MDPLYQSLNYLRQRNFTKCAESCKQIPSSLQKEKWYLVCHLRTEESWLDFTEPDDPSVTEQVFEDSFLSQIPRPGTSFRKSRTNGTSSPSESGYTHVSRNGHSKGVSGVPTSSASSRFNRLATASLSFTGDEPDVTSINIATFARNPFLSRILVDYLLHRLRDPAHAVSLAAECTKVHGFDDWVWKNRLGRAYYLLGLLPEAEAQFRSSIATRPNIESRLELAKLFIRLDQPVKALSELSEGIEQFPNELSFLLAQARLTDLLGDSIKARELWRSVLKMDQANIEAIASIGAVTFYEDQPETSSKFFNYLRQLGLINTAVLNNIAITALESNDYFNVGRAIIAALSAAKNSEEKSDVWYNISHIALTAGEPTLAKQSLMISTALNNKNAEAFNNLGLLELKSKNLQKSLASFKAATEANPNLHEPWFNLALIYEKIGQTQEAYYAAKEAVTLFPMFTEGVEVLERISQQLK